MRKNSGDENITSMLRQSGAAVLLENKIDGQDPDYVSGEFSVLGLGELIKISAKSGKESNHY